MKKFIIKEDVFKTVCLFIFNCNEDEYVEELKKYGIKENKVGEYVCGSVVKLGDKFFRIIWVENAKNKEELMHEIFHLVIRICFDKGVPIRANIETGECGDETAAYLMEFYVKKILEKL